jgi:hypothetical protein
LTERDKMLAGQLYDSLDAALVRARERARDLCQTLNATAVIGAGSVVTRDIPAGVFAGGNPCRVIRELADEHALGHALRLATAQR